MSEDDRPRGGLDPGVEDAASPHALNHGQPEVLGSESAMNVVDPSLPVGEGRKFFHRLQQVESVAASGSFLGMFVVICIGVFYRYVLDAPLTWTVALATSLLIWTTMITAGLPHWKDEHIQFDLIYIKLQPSAQRWTRIIGNLVIIIPAALVIPTSIQYLEFIYPQKISGLGLSLTWAFAGIAYFFITTVLHRSRILVKDVVDLFASHHRRSEATS